MPVNKSALLRYRIIDDCLSRYPYCSKEKLIEQIEERIGKNVSGRTIEDDIRAMKQEEELGYLAPIKYSRRHQGYFYEDHNYAGRRFSLKEEQRESLELTLSILKTYQHTPLLSKTEEVLEIFENLSHSKRITGKPLHDFIVTEPSVDVSGMEWFQKLVDHIQFEHVITIHHKTYQRREERTFEVHPYGLKEFDKRWYLLALRDDVQELRVFGLDRITHISESIKRTGFIPPEQTVEEIFEHVYGVSGFYLEPSKLKIQIPYPQAYYEKSRPIHPSFKVIEDIEDDQLTISLEVVHNWELDKWLSSMNAKIV